MKHPENDTRAYHHLSADDLATVDAHNKAKGTFLPRGPKMSALLDIERRTTHDNLSIRPSYEDVLDARREAYAERIAATVLPKALIDWAMRMSVAHSDTVHVHFQRNLDWVTAFMIVRYGEDPEKWPARLTADQVTHRLDTWESFRDWPGAARLPKKTEPAKSTTYRVEG
jgi:hypothetical protein